MARKRIVSESRKNVIQDFLAEYQPKTAKEIARNSQGFNG